MNPERLHVQPCKDPSAATQVPPGYFSPSTGWCNGRGRVAPGPCAIEVAPWLPGGDVFDTVERDTMKEEVRNDVPVKDGRKTVRIVIITDSTATETLVSADIARRILAIGQLTSFAGTPGCTWRLPRGTDIARFGHCHC